MRRRARLAQADHAWTAACDDARHLAIELAAGRPRWPVDVMSLGLVIEPDEVAYRYVPALLSQFNSASGLWPMPMSVGVLITDRRLVVRLPHGAVISFWWSGILAIDIDIAAARIVLDYGDIEPRLLEGAAAASMAVAAVWGAYGATAMLQHAGLEVLRRSNQDAAARP
jgi:hypothetical protein